MVAYADGEDDVHNTTCTDDVADGWDRTAYLSAGTATYLGQAADGTYLFLTANHVTSSGGSISSSDGNTYTFSYAGTSWTLTNSDGSEADLKIIAVTPDDDATAAYLQGLGSISIYTGTLTTTTALYTVGTGKSISVGGSYDSGSRAKQWAEFYANAALSDVSTTGGTTDCYYEIFTNQETMTTRNGSTTTTTSVPSFQAGSQDSGSGVFIEVEGETQIVGVLIAVGCVYASTSTVNYYNTETLSEYETDGLCCITYFANLSQYADQIAVIMAIPEPSAFSLFAGTAALAFACVAARRRRRMRRERRRSEIS